MREATKIERLEKREVNPNQEVDQNQIEDIHMEEEMEMEEDVMKEIEDQDPLEWDIERRQAEITRKKTKMMVSVDFTIFFMKGN